MKATGIVRRIDDLGRVVIPKEIRRTMRIREGDPLEIFTDADGEVIFKKYSPVGELSSTTRQYAEVLFRGTNLPVLITDRDRVIACAGLSKKEAIDRRVSASLETIIENRTNFAASADAERMRPIEGLEREGAVACPIIGGGDVSGCVVMLANENGALPSQTEIKLIQVAASFLGRQMEE
ncbi:MAG: AbrB/MazE/SpoVT family DNA-binding domain-containing protein [Oscillospiraceae bacterium]|jgi:AbrB family transcriptional regulator (stage V sporulation protein T)|nr:AbrB/MazE/SpoVT family DNA-binding domain-containing protein [Oscillospiraceae bacterium]